MSKTGGGSAGTGTWRLAGVGLDRRLMLPLLEGIPGLAHAFTARGSEPMAVMRDCAGRDLPLRTLKQVHGNVVHVVERAGPAPAGERPLEGDALVTRERVLVLGVNVADCVPILLCDPVSGLVGAAHAGWRGTVAGVLRSTIAVLNRLGARPDDLHVGLGPSIGPCCFEVGPEVVETFRAGDPCADRSIIEGPRARIDLIDANRRQALEAGVPAGRIAAAGLCTVCHPDLLESYRRSRGAPGRMTGLIAWSS
jgi:YfiH family protein